MRKRPHSVIGRLLVAGFFWNVQAFRPSSSWRMVPASRTTTSWRSRGGGPSSRPPSSSSLRVVASSSPVTSQRNPDDDRDITDIMLSYRSNIRRTSQLDGGGDESQAKKPLHSLVHFLEQQSSQSSSTKTATTATTTCTPELLIETIVPAFRVAAKLNDYRLLLRLWEATKTFCTSSFDQQAATALPRLLGEALTCLGQTSASLSKVKRLWQTEAATVPGVSPRETNAYLKLLGHKPRATLQAWESERTRGRTNAYSLALVLQALQASVSDTAPVETIVATDRGYDDDDDGDFVETPFQDWKTNSWQWNEAVNILENDYLILLSDDDDDVVVVDDDDDDDGTNGEWTNPVVTALLQLNHRIGMVDRRHPQAALALAIYEFFVASEEKHALRLAPDVQTCTAVLTCLGDEWERAVEILQAMEANHFQLPAPNAYTYAAALACCARAGEYTTSWNILADMPNPNTVVYNTVLSALTIAKQQRMNASSRRSTRTQRVQSGDRVRQGLSLLSRMQEDTDNDTVCNPDTITYNTLLQIVSGGPVEDWQAIEMEFPFYFDYDSTDWLMPERLVHTLLDKMEEAGVPRDVMTYRHAIASVRSLQGVVQLVGRALKDTAVVDATQIFDSALFVLAQEGDWEGIQLILSKMCRDEVMATESSLLCVIRGLANSGKTRSIPFLVLALMGNKDAAEHLFAVHKLDLHLEMIPSLNGEHLTTAITSCLYRNDFENARRILLHMRDRGVEPSDESLEAIARSYARLALEMVNGKKIPAEAVARAQSACEVVRRLEKAPLRLRAVVTRACAAVGLFSNARKVLQTIHEDTLAERSGQVFRGVRRATLQVDDELISGLHRAVLKSAAEQGNITYALMIAEDIQAFDGECKWGQSETVTTDETISWSEVNTEGDILPPTAFSGDSPYVATNDRMGMGALEWIYILQAASISGHWKVCINTLQFLRPYLRAIHPDRIGRKDGIEKANAEHKLLSKGLVAATKCFAVRSQYGWAVRAIEDWIEWSGRRPPKQAVHASVRILSARGRGDEVYRLIANCLQPGVQDPTRDGKAYEVTLYVNAIAALYKNGLYDAADDVYVSAVSSNVIPFQLDQQLYGSERRITLDLHGMNTAVAHSAVRCALQQEVLGTGWNQTDFWDNDMIIVTGRGKRSSLHMRPILRPEVQRMLIEEFYPPLSTTSVPGNMGALRVSSEGIYEWVDHQRQQKGVRMLAVAAVLKDISSGKRLRQAFAKATPVNPPDPDD
eukprot:scaffold3028_cov174-Amphora_coffeaeformis.AAC.21